MDIALRFDPERGYYDLAFEEDLATDPGLETAVVLSLFTDRRALPADALPGGGNDRRGYWADAFSERLQGSRLWLLSREKELESVRRSAEVYAQEALAWLVEDGVAEAVSVTADHARRGVLLLRVEVQRGSGTALAKEYEYVWRNAA